MCTIKNFPYQIDHTIHWSRDLFAGLFTTSAEEVNSYISNPAYIQELMKQPSRLQTLEVLHDCLVVHRCVAASWPVSCRLFISACLCACA